MANYPPKLSANDQTSFACLVLNERLPMILTKLINYLKTDEKEIADLCNGSRSELKEVTKKIEILKYEMENDKEITPLTVPFQDLDQWNKSLEELKAEMISVPSWYTAPWLYFENYMYRRVFEAFLGSESFKQFDYFRNQKENSLWSSIDAINILGNHLQTILQDFENNDKIKTHLCQLLKICLWSNRCDLSLSVGSTVSQHDNPITLVDSLQPYVLVDNASELATHILNVKNDNPQGLRLAIILDNAGYELFCDLCFLHYLTASKLVGKVSLFVKSMPWYISDTMEQDIRWIIKTLSKNTNESIKGKELEELAKCWQNYLDDGTWCIPKEIYWTLPHPFCDMMTKDTYLYSKLNAFDVLIIKGDLNYRKLTGDRDWNYTTPFETALNGFHPTALCALRTIKANTVVGLAPGQAEEVQEKDMDWLLTGDYALVQFSSNLP